MAYDSLVTEAIDIVWNRGELDRIPEFYSEDFVSHQPETGPRWDPGHEGLRRLITGLKKAYPDYHESIEDVVAAGDRVVLRLMNTGTLHQTSDNTSEQKKSFKVADFMLVRIEDGKIAEQWGLFDLYSMYVQLGYIDPVKGLGAKGNRSS